MSESTSREDFYNELAVRMEQMYYSLERENSNRQVVYVQKHMKKYEKPIKSITSYIEDMGDGTMQQTLLQIMKNEQSSFLNLKTDISSRFKLYVRGLGNSGKSTLVNALLAISEEVGSELDKKPMTFTIESFSDEISVNEAVVTYKGSDGFNKVKKMTREQAKIMAQKERDAYNASKKKCTEIARAQCKGIVNLKEREEIRTAVFRENLAHTLIREIRWGIGSNKYLDNCVLIDTPGLKQELRETNVLEDVHHYEADGIIWVISSDMINSSTTAAQYREEREYFKDLATTGRMITVINIKDDEMINGSIKWKRCIENAQQNYGDKFGHMIGVNNLFAYEGNLKQDQKKIKASNVEELRKIINQLFVTKSSDDGIKNHIDKINRFLKGYQKRIDEIYSVLDNYLTKYNQKSEYIEHSFTGIRSHCETTLNQVRDQYMKDVRSRIAQNCTRINALDDMLPNDRKRFLQDDIIRSYDLVNQLIVTCKYEMDRMLKDYNMIYKNSVVSTYDYIAFDEFSKKNRVSTDISNVKVNKINEQYRSRDDLKSSIERELNSLLGGLLSESITGAVAGLFSRAVKFFENKEKKILKIAREQAEKACSAYQKELKNIANQYEEICLGVRDLSMEQEIGSYESIEDTIQKMKKEQCKLKDMGFVGISLAELIIE